MFIKPFRVKSSTAIRGSDRRKLRAEVVRNFPALPEDVLSDIIPNKEEMTVSRIVTHGGDNLTVYSLSGEPIFFEIEKRIIPTVYTLWKYPDMLPTFTTWPPVIEKLRGGADLMLPGVILPKGGIASLDRFEKNTLWSINLKGNKAPVAVGYTLVSRKDLYEDGMRGKGVHVLHVFTDSLWALGSKSPLPQIVESDLEEKEEENIEEQAESELVQNISGNYADQESEDDDLQIRNEIKNMNIRDTENSETLLDNLQETDHSSQASACCACEEKADSQNITIVEGAIAPVLSPVEEMDKRLEYCFFCALLRIKPERDLPLLTSAFFRNHLLPYCPGGKTVDIKKTSYKKLSKFLQVMQDNGLITVQEVSKGVDHIVGISTDNDEVRTFKSSISSLPAKPETNKSAKENTSVEGPMIEEMYAVSAVLVPIFSQSGYMKGSTLSQSELRKAITNYVKSHELVGENKKRFVVLDPLLTTALVNKNENIEHLAWDALFNRVANKMNSCYKITLPGQPPVLKKGKIDPLEIKIEQRMGNKKVTLVNNLDAYGIDPQQFAHTVQLKAQCSTSEDYKVPKKFISGLELLKSSKKKK